jgi:hypothetical protein
MPWKYHDRWASSNPPRKLQNEKLGTDAESDLTANSNQKISNMRLLYPESDLELNNKIIEDFFIFPVAIYPHMISSLGVMQF